MQYVKCPDCGANLDPGEKCDCKEEGLPRANGNSPENVVSEPHHENSITQRLPSVKSPLTALRVGKELSMNDMVEVVRTLYPKYDKPLQSKCERGELYGVNIKPQALDALYRKFAPELLEKEKRRRDGNHRLHCRVSCRLEEDEYAVLTQIVKDDGFDTMQAWMTHIIRTVIHSRKENVRV